MKKPIKKTKRIYKPFALLGVYGVKEDIPVAFENDKIYKKFIGYFCEAKFHGVFRMTLFSGKIDPENKIHVITEADIKRMLEGTFSFLTQPSLKK